MPLNALAHGYKRGAQYPSLLLKTGQTTQYNSELDDGYYQKGVSKSYTINTTGAQSGIFAENIRYVTEYDERVIAAGGTKTMAAIQIGK